MSVPPSVTLAEYAETFLARAAHRLKRRTLETYADNLRLYLLPALGPDTPLAMLTRATVRAALLAKLDAGYMGGTVKLMQRVLCALLNAAIDEDALLTANPAARLGKMIPKRKGPQAQRPLSRERLRRFLDAARRIHLGLYALFVIGARAGLRLGELLGLRWDDVDFTRRVVVVQRGLDWRRVADTPKGNKTAVLPLSGDAVRALTELRASAGDECPWIFHGPSGRPWSRTHVRRIMHRACVAAGLDHASPHALRHSFVTQLAERGVDAFRIRDLARHASLVETETYLHLTGHLHADVDRLDGAG